MNISENVPLLPYTTMHLGGTAAYLCDIVSKQEIPEALTWAKAQNLPVLMIGSGSNIFWQDAGFNGLVLVNKIPGFDVFNEDDNTCYLTIGAGENWDETVNKTVSMGYSGIEELSLIPGTAGATPIQNVGAYGREIKDVLVTLEAYDSQTMQFVTLRASDCAFAYRTSRFKTTDKGRFFICSITLRLTKDVPKPPFYQSLQHYFSQHNINEFSVQVVRDAVIDIRSSKLPDVAKVSNNGSFFYNPIISQEQLVQLRAAYPEISYWQVDDNHVKVSAAWLLETAGFKDMHDQETGIGTWPTQPLVLVNEHAKQTADLLKFKQKIVDTIQNKFGITLEQEPELLP